ncbi:MAG: hypothetical protein KDD69_09945 [Bdellovibrionales bacterium]|nr:hypothetical protein [Bdellovibrionales bacterium]
MAQAYAPALEVSERTIVRKVRELPLPGKHLVQQGQWVEATTSVLAAELPGDLSIIRAADRLGFEVEDVMRGIVVSVGEQVVEGQELARVKSFFGWFQSALPSPAAGTIEFITEANAHIGIRHAPIPLSVDAYVQGRVIEVEPGKAVTIETEAGFIQGIFGVGGERRGHVVALAIPPDLVVTDQVLAEVNQPLDNAILVGGATFDQSGLRYAAEQRVSAVICGSIDAPGLADFVGYEIGVSITGDEPVPFTLIVTEGFGRLAISERVRSLAKQFHGRNASVNGATQVRAGATRPELIVPLEPAVDRQIVQEAGQGRPLEVGAKLRIIRVPYFGAFGTITALPSEPESIPSGARVRVLRARLESGEEVTVPRANVELVP